MYNPSFQQYFFAEDRSFGGYAPVVGGIPFLTIPPFEIHAASALSIIQKREDLHYTLMRVKILTLYLYMQLASLNDFQFTHVFLNITGSTSASTFLTDVSK